MATVMVGAFAALRSNLVVCWGGRRPRRYNRLALEISVPLWASVPGNSSQPVDHQRSVRHHIVC